MKYAWQAPPATGGPGAKEAGRSCPRCDGRGVLLPLGLKCGLCDGTGRVTAEQEESWKLWNSAFGLKRDNLKGGREMKHTEIPNEVSKLLNALNDAQKKTLDGILDTGHRTEFETGAVRDAAPGRGRCDLLPLDVIDEWLGDSMLGDIDNYIRTGEVDLLYSALESFIEVAFPDTHTAILEVAVHYEDGAKKYKERNWEQGIPLHCYIDSAVRHYLKWLRGDDDERHDRAVVWNLLCAAWTHKHKPDMIDLPFAEGVKK